MVCSGVPHNGRGRVLGAPLTVMDNKMQHHYHYLLNPSKGGLFRVAKRAGGRIDPHTFISPSIDEYLRKLRQIIFRGLSITSHNPHVIIIKTVSVGATGT